MVKSTEQHVTIKPLNKMQVTVEIEGTSPYVQLRFSQKAKIAIQQNQEAGGVAKSKKNRKPRDFDEDFQQAMYLTEEGHHGIPASAFRNCCIDACRLVGFKMTHAKMSIFIQADGYDHVEGTPLIRLHGGEPKRTDMMVRNATGVIDIRVRPMWRTWSAFVRIQFDADQFSVEDIVNLFSRAGQQCGVGEGRPFSKSSNGMGFGTFIVKNIVNG